MALTEVQVPTEPMERFATLASEERMQAVRDGIERARELLEARVVWNVNSTAAGGGVAEMLQVLLAYARGAGVDARWIVIEGEPDFFTITKRLHNVMHGSPGDGGPLGDEERRIYERVVQRNAEELAELVNPDDLVVLHDPQTAGMTETLQRTGATVVWRCHIGPHVWDEVSSKGADFLRPYVEPADGYVFTRSDHVLAGLPSEKVEIVPPSIDPFAPKNMDLNPENTLAIVRQLGVVDGRESEEPPAFRRRDGSPARVVRHAQVVRGPKPVGPDVPVVLQVSRWDRLKDMEGVLRGFARHVGGGAHLMLVGPSVEGVSDDPEGEEVLAECVRAWDDLDADLQQRVWLICLPMDDVEENAVMVNALQRHAAVVVQKSLAEGFGLTVTEAMFKGRPVVASAIGGIRDQIEDGVNGVLLPEPRDLDAFGNLLQRLLEQPDRMHELGEQARRTVVGTFMGDRHLLQYVKLFGRLSAGRG